MAYPIKNTAVVQTNSIKTGNFALGVNPSGMDQHRQRLFGMENNQMLGVMLCIQVMG